MTLNTSAAQCIATCISVSVEETAFSISLITNWVAIIHQQCVVELFPCQTVGRQSPNSRGWPGNACMLLWTSNRESVWQSTTIPHHNAGSMLPADACEVNAGIMLVQRLRRWPILKPALVQPLVFSGIFIYPYSAGIDFSRQNLTSINVRFWSLRSIPAL